MHLLGWWNLLFLVVGLFVFGHFTLIYIYIVCTKEIKEQKPTPQ